MPIIQPTTPTSEGFAQAFDTSGLVQLEAMQKEKKNKKLQDLMVDYDTKGIFTRDIPYVQEIITDTQNFAMEHAEALANPSSNLDVWREYEKKKSRVKNVITGSIAAKEYAKSATNRYYNGANGLFMTNNNLDILNAYASTPSREQYEDFSAFDDPSKLFDRNHKINPKDYAKAIVFDKTPIEDTGERIGGKIVTKKGAKVNEEASRAGLKMFWDKQDLEGSSLHDIYKGDFDKFYQESIKMAENPTEYGITSPVREKEAKAPTAKDMGREAAVQFTDKSRQSTVESRYQTKTTEGGWFKEGVDVLAPLDKIDTETGEKVNLLSTYGMATTGDGKNVMVFKPMKIMKNVTSGYDATTGEMITAGEGKKYKYQYPVERGNYLTSAGSFEMTYKEDGKYVTNKFTKGEALPDIEKMLKSDDITQNEYDRVTNFVEETEGYMVYASKESVDYFDLAKTEDRMNMLKSGGMKLMMVPFESLDFEVDQALMDEYGVDQQWYIDQKTQGQPQQDNEDYLDF